MNRAEGARVPCAMGRHSAAQEAGDIHVFACDRCWRRVLIQQHAFGLHMRHRHDLRQFRSFVSVRAFVNQHGLGLCRDQTVAQRHRFLVVVWRVCIQVLASPGAQCGIGLR